MADNPDLSRAVFRDLDKLLAMGASGSKLKCDARARALKPGGRPPAARESSSAIALSPTKMLIFGGGSSDADGDAQQFNDCHVLDLETSEWSLLATSGDPPAPRTGHSMVVVGGEGRRRAYVFGGCSVGAGYLNDLHELDLQTFAWKEAMGCGPIPCPRDKHSACVLGDMMYVWGGFGPEAEEEKDGADGDDDDLELDDVEEGEEARDPSSAAQFMWFGRLYALDTNTMQWEQLDTTGAAPSPRAAHGACVLGASMLVFGGRDSEARQGDTYLLDTRTLEWTHLAGAAGSAPPARSFHSLVPWVCPGGAPFALCYGGLGLNGDAFGAPVWAFDPRSGGWAAVEGPSTDGWPPARSACSCAALGAGGEGALVIFGGASGHGDFFGDVHHVEVAAVGAALDAAAAEAEAKASAGAGA